MLLFFAVCTPNRSPSEFWENKGSLSEHVREVIKIFIKDYLNFMPKIISLENMHKDKKWKVLALRVLS